MKTPADAKVAAIVPAWNEDATLAGVLAPLQATPRIGEILVVSDGSTDSTVEIARGFCVKTIHLTRNHGKATALAMGVAHTRASLLLFVDGDILNLDTAMIERLIEPVLSGRVAMAIGARDRGRLLNAIYRRFGPKLSGIRCLRREVFEAVPQDFLRGFRVETALNWSCVRLRLPYTTTVLYGLKHLVKEKKRGLCRGACARVAMFAAVFDAYLRLRLTRPDLRRATAAGRGRPELDSISF